MSEQSEAGDIGAAADSFPHEYFRGCTVQLHHAVDRSLEVGLIGLLFFPRGSDDSRTEGLRQDDLVAGTDIRLCHKGVRMSEAHDGETVLRLLVVHSVTSRENAAGLFHLLSSALQDLRDNRVLHVPREGADIQSHRDLSPHGIYVAHHIHRRDGAEAVGIVDHGRKEVHRQDDSPVRAQPIHGGIVADLESYE
jgi:hypothetical protein